MAKVVVTGAHSYLGASVVDALQRTGHESVGVVTPWTKVKPSTPGAEYFAADLRKPLPPDLAERVGAADRILHLAWSREPTLDTSVTANQRMLATLLSCAHPARVTFFSSVAAARRTSSIYGAAKWRIQEDAIRAGCSAYVCGLVLDDPPRSAYGLVHAVVASVPLRVRFVMGTCRVYPIALGDLLDSIVADVSSSRPSAACALFFPAGVSLNEFLGVLEQRLPRARMPVPVPLRPVMIAARLLRATVARNLGERLLTFLEKDDQALSELPRLPTLSLQKTDAFLAARLKPDTTNHMSG